VWLWLVAWVLLLGFVLSVVFGFWFVWFGVFGCGLWGLFSLFAWGYVVFWGCGCDCMLCVFCFSLVGGFCLFVIVGCGGCLGCFWCWGGRFWFFVLDVLDG